MATKRVRNGAWQYTVKRKGVLDKPRYYTFDSEVEGDAFCARLEAMLDKGLVPAEMLATSVEENVETLVAAYRVDMHPAPSDEPLLNLLVQRNGSTRLASLDYEWGARWVKEFKERGLSPNTIKHHVGAFSRCIDWALRSKHCDKLLANPFKLLPKGYALKPGESEVERDRRLEPGEEEKLRAVLEGDYLLMFNLALETGMRMSEIYTLTPEKVDIERKTIFLTNTKDPKKRFLKGEGRKRQVPMSTTLRQLMVGFKGFDFGPKSAATTSKLSVYFGRRFKKAGCEDLNFHDLRHEATCRFYERTKLSDLQIAKILGHKDPRMLARYANLRGSDLADELW